MLTAPITAAIAGILALFGIQLTAGRLLAVAIVVKVIIVSLGMLLGLRLGMRRRKAAALESQVKAATDPKLP